ncbi:MAG TPA: S-layer homology domain-containing protein [Acidimicrobiia bacterium]|nr:S-layer homology domain-containing protein [Acidimicrobiia bacterium]
MTRLWRRWTSVGLALAMVVVAAPAGAEDTKHTVVRSGDDVRIVVGEPTDSLVPQATDPLGLLVGVDTIRQHTLGEDIFDVWSCGVADSAASLAAGLQQNVGTYFEFHSRGRYQPKFVARGNAGDSDVQCELHSQANASSNANAALHITPVPGGYASPGVTCGFTPCASPLYRDGNSRAGFIGNSIAFYSTAAHEIGHMLHWPHSYTGLRTDFFGEYDNALDVMSGNYGLMDGGGYGTYPDPYATASINLYAAGWIDPDEVRVVSGSESTFDLVTGDGDGVRMAALRAGSRIYVFGARVPSTYDPIPDQWAGIEVYEVEICTTSEFDCLFDDSKLPGFRRVKPYPVESFDDFDLDSYTSPLAHVIQPGTSRSIAGAQVNVGEISGNAIRMTIDPPEGPSFTDTGGHIFAADIEWLAESGITKGCNPPANSEFCPDDAVTRGQMAAFLHRALPGLAAGSTTDFSDDNASVFEADIEWLAATGVTRGCNPPANDRFCPDDSVTRGAMAAFLHRALGG